MAARSYTVRSQAGLETYNDAPAPEVEQPGLEPQQSIPEVYQHQYTQPFLQSDAEKEYPQGSGNLTSSKTRGNRIFGLRTTTFWLSLALVVVILVAIAVGAGYGGLEAADNKDAAAAQSSKASAGTQSTAVSIQTVTAAGSTVTITHQVAAASATPSSDCAQYSGENWVGLSSKLAYKRVCGVDLSTDSARQDIIATPKDTFEDCIGMCDSYNWFMNTRNMTVAVWNWIGSGDQTLGTCWCEQAAEYKLAKSPGDDSAALIGTFDSSDLPS